MSNPGLFPDAVQRSRKEAYQQPQGSAADRSTRVRRSALWAAYGDALGWISELTNSRGLKRRTAGEPLRRPIEWERRIGGRGGVTAMLPTGCYSDDSQLRLATARAIRPSGFDVEAFAKVELPVWLAYALGGGKSTTAAATNLAKKKTPWYANTFKGWTRSGGNGAAMRIQPHVWSAAALSDAESFLPDVVRNAVCTHSHPGGLMGSVVHALSLAHAMNVGCYPSSDDLMAAVETTAALPEMMQDDFELARYWRPAFEREVGPFAEAWAKAVVEARTAVNLAGRSAAGAVGEERYATMIDQLRLREPDRRGSGMLTAIAAVGLIWCEERPEEALRIAANAIGTDTDTIATMAGAILGVTAGSEPPIEVLDADLFCSEADRLAEIARGGAPSGHRYPDLLHWVPPKMRADALTSSNGGGLYVRGLGAAESLGEPMASVNDRYKWQWLKLETGQTLLIKRRTDLPCDAWRAPAFPHGRSSQLARTADGDVADPGLNFREADDVSAPELHTARSVSNRRPERSEPLDLQRALKYVAAHKDDDRSVGRALRRVVNKGSPAQIAGFTAALIEYIRRPDDTEQSPQGVTEAAAGEDDPA